MSRDDAAMVNLSDENRDLLLSLYLDGELEPEQANAVAEKIRSDEAWQTEYALLRSSETRITKVVENSWHDEEFTTAVRQRLRNVPPPAPSEAPSGTRKAWPFWAMTLLLTAILATVLWTRQWEPPPVVPPSAPQAQIVQGSFKIAGRVLTAPFDLRAGDEATATSDLLTVRWADGSRLWLSKDTLLGTNAQGSPAIATGRALITVPEGGVGLWPSKAWERGVELREGTFDVEATASGLRVRVLTGTARPPNGRTIAGAGQTLAPDGAVENCDLRELLADWGDTGAGSMDIGAEWPSAWPQPGGSAGHTGLTPVHGPATLKFTQDLAFDDGRETEHLSAACVRSGREIYLARQEAPDQVALYCYLDSVGTRRWTAISRMPGQLTVSPVISTTGLILFGTNGKLLRACDYSGTSWESDLGSALSSITVLPDGQIVCGTFQRLVSFGENGKERWAYQGLADFQPPVAFSHDGTLLAFSRTGKAACLSLDGKERAGHGLDLAPRTGPFGWPVIQQDGSVWITTASGELLTAALPGSKPRAPKTEERLLLTAPPLADGTCAVGHEIVLANGSRIETPGNEAVIALAGDGAGRLYVATQDAVHLYACNANGQTPPVLVESAPLKQGRIIPAGLAIAPGKLIVTTTGGVVVFEEQP